MSSMMREKVIFSKTEIFWPQKIQLGHLKGFQAYLIDEGYVFVLGIKSSSENKIKYIRS